MKYKKVKIEWIDSIMGLPGWNNTEDIQPLKPEICHTVGFLLEDEKEYKTICHSYGNNEIGGRMSIPSCSITKMAFIKG